MCSAQHNWYLHYKEIIPSRYLLDCFVSLFLKQSCLLDSLTDLLWSSWFIVFVCQNESSRLICIRPSPCCSSCLELFVVQDFFSTRLLIFVGLLFSSLDSVRYVITSVEIDCHVWDILCTMSLCQNVFLPSGLFLVYGPLLQFFMFVLFDLILRTEFL